MTNETPRSSSAASARPLSERIKTWCEPARQLSWWTSWFNIVLGVTVMCAGFVFFINPYNIVPGGVYGASIVLHNIFPSIQVGTFGYFFDIPLLVLASVFLGAKLGSRTIFAALIAPVIMTAFRFWPIPMPLPFMPSTPRNSVVASST